MNVGHVTAGVTQWLWIQCLIICPDQWRLIDCRVIERQGGSNLVSQVSCDSPSSMRLLSCWLKIRP
jgi:hypothetical protein